ncbi:MAG TPA: hypothetical protein ENK23_05295 [Sorangium sp.]|nr:hypothetical protein [Sorangium sp.]
MAAGATGCASRAAPFNDLDKAQVTILRLQAPQQAAVPGQQPGATIPGLPPELTTFGQQTLQQTLQQMQQQGLLPPGPLPGVPGQPTTPQQPLFRGQWMITDSRPVADPDLRDRLLDLFGDADSFNEQRGNCFYPGMAVSFTSPDFAEPVDVVVSLSCNQAMGYGFNWPHANSGFTQQTHSELTNIYQSLFGPVPAGA